MLHSSVLSWLMLAAAPSLVTAAIAIKGPSGPNAGINSQTGERPARQEINKFKTSGAAWDLYVQSFAQFQASQQGDIQSYYQVAGVHGYPKIPWDGVSGGGYQPGYCTHSSILFPSWHRPYLALFEQVLWNNAQTIAQRYTGSQKDTYVKAAQTFRMPYWDWAANAAIPAELSSQKITINTPTGSQSIDNPLYSYKFHPQPSASDFPHDSSGIYRYTQTVRCPDRSGNSQPSVANRNMQANAQSLKSGTYNILASQPNFGPFSNTGWPGSSSFQSVENLHNTVHGVVGGNGHMAWVPYSAFDPIFWLHHTNVDRIFAMWQAIYPNSYVTSETTSGGTYTNPPGSTEDVNTPLTPFHSDTGGTLYTSATARSTRSFGYTYPEVQDWNVSAQQLSSNVRAAVNALYNPNGGTSAQRRVKARGAALAPRAVDALSANKQWALNFKGDKKKIPVSLLVHFFLGDPASNDTNTWPTDPGFVATQAVLIDPSLKDSSAVAPILKGQVPLTHKLLPVVPSLDDRPVVDELKATLQFRVQTLDGNVVAPKDISGDQTVSLEVVSRDVQQTAASDAFPNYGDWVTHANGTFQGGTWSLGKSLEWIG